MKAYLMRRTIVPVAATMLYGGGGSAGEMVNETFAAAPLSTGWTFYKEAWKLEQPTDAKDAPVWNDEGFLVVDAKARWNAPPFKCEPFKYYKLTFKSKAKVDSLWGALFYDKDGKMLDADIYASVHASDDWVDNVGMLRGREGNVSAKASFVSAGEPFCIDDVKVVEVDGKAVAEWLDTLYNTMPPVAYQPPPDRWKFIPKTMERLQSGEPIRIVMLGDSIINDTNNSNFEVLLSRWYPKAEIKIIPSVRGGTGCWYYEDPVQFKSYVVDQKPDLLIIGGISHHSEIEPIRNVIRMARRDVGDEILLMSGPVGEDWRKFDEKDPTKLAADSVCQPAPFNV